MKTFLSVILGLIIGVFIHGQKIPLDKTVRHGKLDNGLTYYIKQNKKPEKKVELRLAINAGSVLEDDDQQGLAHFMEHMNFNGTKNFPGNELVDNLQAIGVRFGQHLNAYTSFDETVYILPIPLEKPENLDIGMQILEDWAFNALLTEEEIDKERGVVLEELRLGLGADKRMLDKYLPKVLYKSKYAERLPIGKKEILENFKPEVLRRFHTDWYRPDLMAVIVVGDIDVDDMENRIKKQFGKYSNPTNERERKNYDVPTHEQTFVVVETDPEATNSQVQLMFKDYDNAKPLVTVEDYRKSVIRDLYSSMINDRLNEFAQGANPPFTFGYSYYGGSWARTKNAYQSFAMTQDQGHMEALKVLLEENERVKRFGFNQSELDRAKETILNRLEKAYNDRDKTESSRLVNRYVRNFLEQEAEPGIEWEYEYTKKTFPSITLDEVNGLIKNYLHDDNRVVILTGPEKENVQMPNEDEVMALFNEVAQSDIKPYDDSMKIEKLVNNLPSKGSVVKSEKSDRTDATTWTLSNGAKVSFIPTDYKNDEILFSAVRLGGSSLVSDDVIKKVRFAFGGLSQAGLSGYSKNDLDKYLADKIANVSPYMSSLSEGLNGSCTPKDVETLFELIYANFTALNKDEEAFNTYVTKQKAFMGNLAATPQYYFMLEFNKFLLSDNPRIENIIPTEEDWNNTDYPLAYDIFTKTLKNAGDFHFFFVGNVDEAQLKNLVEKYIATLPSVPNEKTMYKDDGYRNIKGTHKKVYTKGTDPKSFVQMQFYGDAKYNEKDNVAMSALAEVIGIKLVEKLREDASGTYTSRVNGGLSDIPYEEFNFSVFFPCGPENVDNLIKITQDEIKRVIAQGPDQKDLDKFKEAENNQHKERAKENRTWLNLLKDENEKSGAVTEYYNYLDRVDELTVKDVQYVAQKYLSGDYVLGILMPEETDQKEEVKAEASTMDSDLTVQQVLANYYKAIGGKEKIESVKTINLKAEMKMAGMSIPMEQKEIVPTKVFSKMSIMGNDQITLLSENESYVLAGGNKNPIPADKTTDLIKEQSLLSTILLPDDEIKTAQMQQIGDEKLYILKSDTEEYVFDGKTFTLVKKASLDNTRVLNFEDWKVMSGIKFPMVQNIKVNGQDIEMKIQSLSIDGGDVTDADFQ